MCVFFVSAYVVLRSKQLVTFAMYVTGSPMKQESPLKFCSYNGSVCCDSTQDLLLHKQFEALNVVDPACATLLKSTICAVSLCRAKMSNIYYKVRSLCANFCSSMHDADM